MFCPKCGQSNPETGKFCRSCGTDLGNVTQALASPPTSDLRDGRKRHRGGCEAAYTQLAMGAAFVIISIILGATGNGRGWWFWMLVPGFIFIGNGVAKLAQAKSDKRSAHAAFASESNQMFGAGPAASLTPAQSDFISPAESRYKTGDLVPPSVTEGTTRHLDIDSEGKTMTLPKN
jgi:hypothetical protein